LQSAFESRNNAEMSADAGAELVAGLMKGVELNRDDRVIGDTCGHGRGEWHDCHLFWDT